MDSNRPTVFISYSHKDEAWKERLVQQLRVLDSYLDVWDDHRIGAGNDWEPAIEAAMAEARVAVLLISADFLTSGFINGTEVPEILRRRQKNGLRVIPVIVRPCPWTAVPWLATIQSRPKDGRPLSAGTDHQVESDLSDLALEIRSLLAPPSPGGREGMGEGPGVRDPSSTTSPTRPSATCSPAARKSSTPWPAAEPRPSPRAPPSPASAASARPASPSNTPGAPATATPPPGSSARIPPRTSAATSRRWRIRSC